LKLSHRASVMLTFGNLAVLGVGWWWRDAFIVAGTFILALLALSARLYRFFMQKRGWWFTLRVVPWHWLYFFYSGLALGIGIVRHLCVSLLFVRRHV